VLAPVAPPAPLDVPAPVDVLDPVALLEPVALDPVELPLDPELVLPVPAFCRGESSGSAEHARANTKPMDKDCQAQPMGERRIACLSGKLGGKGP
jgi:hypothetical protein